MQGHTGTSSFVSFDPRLIYSINATEDCCLVTQNHQRDRGWVVLLLRIQIVGGKNASWHGIVDTSSSNAIGGYEDEYDWDDRETDLYHWTKTLRPIQVLLRKRA
nr:DAR GTPase 3, chloroplastic [Tanacetum cinerariifolium]